MAPADLTFFRCIYTLTDARPCKFLASVFFIGSCTSHIERANLTVRTFIRRFTRLSLGFSKKLENLKAACAVNFAYYNFCWRPRTTRITPAMAAGVVNTLWNMDNLYDAATGA